MATRSQPEAHNPDVACRRQFIRWLAGGAAGLGLGLTGRVARAAPVGVPPRWLCLPPTWLAPEPEGSENRWSPGPDWERVPSSQPGEVSRWRKTGSLSTDWTPSPRSARIRWEHLEWL